MVQLSTIIIDPDEIYSLMKAVGVDPATVSTAAWDTSFEDLDVDSLGRLELATRVQERWGIDIEDEIVEELTPNQLVRLVDTRLCQAGAA